MALDLKEDEKLILPAQQEVVLDKLWIRQIIINTPSPLAEGSVRIEYGPWSGDMSKDAVWRDINGNDTAKFLQLNDLYQTMIQCPELKTAFDAILAAMAPIKTIVDDRAAQSENPVTPQE